MPRLVNKGYLTQNRVRQNRRTKMTKPKDEPTLAERQKQLDTDSLKLRKDLEALWK